MKKTNNDPFKGLILDKEERTLENHLENGEYEEDAHFEDTKIMLQEAASQYHELNRSKPVTLRINKLDLIKIKAKAKRKNVPYQTLLGVLIHDFAEGERPLVLK